MTILVTGSTGLVGTALRKKLGKDAIFTSSSDYDLVDFNQTYQLFHRTRPQKVIHLAALVGGIGGNIMKSGDYFYKNIQINTNVLECARQFRVQKLVSFMSTCVFPKNGPWPLKPEYLHQGIPHESNFAYAYAKRMLDVQTRAYQAQWGTNFFVAIPTNIYGPNDNFNLEEGHVVAALIRKIHLAKETNSDLKVWGTGKPLREFIHSEDIANLTIWMLNNYRDNDPLILSTGVETSISDLVKIIANKLNFGGEITYDISKPDGQYRKPSDNSRVMELIPNHKFISLEEGISDTVEWYLENYPNVRR